MDLIPALLSLLHSAFITLGTIVAVIITSFTGQITTIAPLSPTPTTLTNTSNSIPVPAKTAVTTTTTKVATTTKSKVSSTNTNSAKQTEQKVATTSLPPLAEPAPILSSDALNAQTRGALVNILCTTASGGVFRPISGSGVFIDTRGVILTTAHVGQFFLLKDYPFANNVTCTIRTGAPARPTYYATLLYLPPQWITDNATQLIAEPAKGTGENDYAFLLVTASVNPASLPLPTTFPALAMDQSDPFVSENTLLAGYPAGFLDGSSIESNLYMTSAYAAIQKLYTFTEDISHIDLISIGGTVVSQGGSSGGAVVRAYDGKLVGVISTDTVAATTAERDLRAITIAHIDRSLFTAQQGGIQGLLSKDLSAQATLFASTTAPLEKATLLKVLEKK